LPALLLAKCLLCCKQIAIGHGGFAFDSRGGFAFAKRRLCLGQMANGGFAFLANGKAKKLGGSWGILQPHRRARRQRQRLLRFSPY
jgi:hypothetical protein